MSNPPLEPRPTNVRWLIVAMLIVIVALAHFNRVSISVAGNENFIGSDKLSESEMGLVYSAFLFVYTLGMLPGGWLIDYVGPRRAMTGMGLGLGFCVAMTGFVGWFGLAVTAMLVPLLVIRGLAGATSVPLHPGAARSVSLWLPASNRSTANGFITAGALIGIALSYPVFGWLMDRVGWQAAFVICGLILMLFALIWWNLAADNPLEHDWANAAERKLVMGRDSNPSRVRGTFRDFLRLFQNRGLVLLTLSYGAVNYVQYMFFYWIEYYFKEKLHLSRSESREASFMVSMAMAVGMACGGWVADWLCRQLGQTLGCRVMAFIGMSSAMVFSLLGVSTTDPQQVTWCFALALGTLGLAEGIFWTTAPTLESRNGGLACAMLNTGGNGIGMLGPIFTPLLGKEFGWTTAIIVACVICSIGGVLWLGIKVPTVDGSPSTSPTGRPLLE